MTDRNQRRKARFITFEGIDGAGKSTQAQRLAELLTTKGIKTLLTREPGGAPGAEDIRRLLVEGDPKRWSAETEIMLFTAARRDHLERTIWPALQEGIWVICDRFADSTRVYQGATRGELRALVDRIHDAIIGVEPDLTLILDMPPETALTRGLARNTHEDRFEAMGLAFQKRLRSGFLELAQAYPERCIKVDAQGSSDEVSARIWSSVSKTWAL